MDLLSTVLFLTCFNFLQVHSQEFEPCFSEGSVSIRSSSSSTTSSPVGRVEYCLRPSNGDGSLFWATVCNSTFQLNEAHVACRTVNPTYAAYNTLSGAIFSKSDLNYQIEVQCGGYESSLSECNITEVPSSSACNMLVSAAGVNCNTRAVDNSVILAGSRSDTEGYVMMYVDNRWSFLIASPDYWTDTHAGVVCRQLGYKGGAVPSNTNGPHSRSDNPAKHQANFECSSSARGLGECSNTSLIFSSTMMAAVSCTLLDVADGTVRFNRGNTDEENEGELEIAFSGRYGAVCSSDFGSQEADVACRQLGYNSSSYKSSSVFASRPHYLSGLDCTGTESSLLDCIYNKPLGGACSSGEGVQVTCSFQHMDRNPDVKGSEEGLSGAEIAGIVISCLLVLLFIFFVSVYHKRIEDKIQKSIKRIQEWQNNRNKRNNTALTNVAVLSTEAPSTQMTNTVRWWRRECFIPDSLAAEEAESVASSTPVAQHQEPRDPFLSAEAPPAYLDADKFQKIAEEEASDFDKPPPYINPMCAELTAPPPEGEATYALSAVPSYLLTAHAYLQTCPLDPAYPPPPPPNDFSCPPPDDCPPPPPDDCPPPPPDGCPPPPPDDCPPPPPPLLQQVYN